MQKMLVRSLLVATGTVLAIGIAPAVVLAHEGEGQDDSVTTSNNSPTVSRQETETHSDTNQNRNDKLKAAMQHQENEQHGLSALKLRACNQRKNNIATIMKRSEARADNQLVVFDKITTRVEAFYAKKGNVLTNYDALVAAVTSAKSTAQSNITALKSLSFSCDSDDPKGQAQLFKTQLDKVRQSLKDYRTAVKNLIVGVKSVNGEARKQGDEQ